MSKSTITFVIRDINHNWKDGNNGKVEGTLHAAEHKKTIGIRLVQNIPALPMISELSKPQTPNLTESTGAVNNLGTVASYAAVERCPDHIDLRENEDQTTCGNSR